MPREPTGSERQLVKTSHLAKFEPYVANGAHRANANMGIIQSDEPPPEFKSPFGDFYLANMEIYSPTESQKTF